MICLLVFASVVLPGVLGGCCYPDKYTATVFVSGYPFPRKTTVDFTKDRYVNRLIGHATLEYLLHDQAAGKGYFMFKDGTCVIKDTPKSFVQCISNYQKSWGNNTLAGGSAVETFVFNSIDGSSYIDVVTKENCVPVFSVIHDDDTRKAEITMDVSLTISEDEINPDLSSCKPVGDVVG